LLLIYKLSKILRDTTSGGFDASVVYVVEELEQAGYVVDIQDFIVPEIFWDLGDHTFEVLSDEGFPQER